MKKNLYFKRVYSRTNGVKEFFLFLLIPFTLVCRIPIEMITRRNMGERYFSSFISVCFICALAYAPVAFSSGYGGVDMGFLWENFTTWYLYLGLLIYCTFKRWQEVRHNPSVFDFGRFSLSPGERAPWFDKFPFNTRVKDMYLEPLTFFVPGLLLMWIGQPLGGLFVACAILYHISYWSAYYFSDCSIMDKIDEIICSKDMQSVFLDNEEAPGGTPFLGRMPSDPEHRKIIVDAFLQRDEEIASEVI